MGVWMATVFSKNPRGAAGLGAAAFVLFVVWCANTSLFVGHYETHWGPGWLIALSWLTCVLGLVSAFVVTVRRPNLKRCALLFLIALLTLPVTFAGLFQLADQRNAFGEAATKALEAVLR